MPRTSLDDNTLTSIVEVPQNYMDCVGLNDSFSIAMHGLHLAAFEEGVELKWDTLQLQLHHIEPYGERTERVTQAIVRASRA